MTIEHQTMLEDLDELRRIHPPQLVAQDPRPDLVEDHAAWEKLLNLAYGVHGAMNPDSLFWLLDGLRCMGCGLARDARGWRLTPGECQEYDRFKREYLAPRKQQVVEILEMLNQTGGEQ